MILSSDGMTYIRPLLLLGRHICRPLIHGVPAGLIERVAPPEGEGVGLADGPTLVEGLQDPGRKRGRFVAALGRNSTA